MKKIEPYSDEYKELVYREAVCFCPPIYPCQKCGHPVVTGYICGGCHDSNPSEKDEENSSEA